MLGRSLALFALLLLSCAQPKYATSSLLQTQQASADSSVADCRIQFSKSALCLTWHWEVVPTATTTPGTLTFKVFRPNALDTSPVQIDPPNLPNFLLWMSSMGHGSSPASLTRLDVGTYRVNNIYFIMRGPWELHFQLKSGTVVDDEAVVAVQF